MTKAEDIRNRRLALKARLNSDSHQKLKEIRKSLAMIERSAPNSNEHKQILDMLITESNKLRNIHL